jgi:hypothetical protein
LVHVWFAGVVPGGAMHARVVLPLNVAAAHPVPFVQFVLLQHVSSHFELVHTPERQSGLRAHEAPGAPDPWAPTLMVVASMQ